jgi:hypothetical protein
MERPLREGAEDADGAVAGARQYTARPLTGPSPVLHHSVPRELFGLAVCLDDRTTTCLSCPRCGASAAVIAPGSGPPYAALRCLRGHHLKWLAKSGVGR